MVERNDEMARIAARACAPRRDAHRRERAGVVSDAADPAHSAVPGRRRGRSRRPRGDRPGGGGYWGAHFVLENKAGAGGVLATDAAAKAMPDGYTLLLTTPNHSISAALNSKLPYDAEKDLMPVLVVAEVPELLVSHPSAPFETLRDSSNTPRKHPGKLNYSSAGNGTLPHVTMELLLRRTGVEVAHIPYRARHRQ